METRRCQGVWRHSGSLSASVWCHTADRPAGCVQLGLWPSPAGPAEVSSNWRKRASTCSKNLQALLKMQTTWEISHLSFVVRVLELTQFKESYCPVCCPYSLPSNSVLPHSPSLLSPLPNPGGGGRERDCYFRSDYFC